MGQVRKIRPPRPETPSGRERLIQAHVRRMRRISQRIEHRDLDPAHLLDGRRRHFLAIAQVGEAFPTALSK